MAVPGARPPSCSSSPESSPSAGGATSWEARTSSPACTWTGFPSPTPPWRARARISRSGCSAHPRARGNLHRRSPPLPPLACRAAAFSSLPVPIYDPLTTNCSSGRCPRQPFPGNIIPPGRISPISRYFQSFLPDPTNSSLQNNYLGSVPTGFHNDNATVKLDAHLSARHQVSALFAHGSRRQATPYRGGVLPLPYAETRLVEEIPTTAQLKHALVIGSRLVNQATLGL